MGDPQLRVLLVEGDEDDYIVIRNLFAEISTSGYELDWVNTYHTALETMTSQQHDIYLFDYRLGNHTGLDLLKEAVGRGCKAPIILLTGQGDHRVDLEAMKIGVADYLVKGQINPDLLERSVRYAIERKRSEETLRESQKQLKYFSSKLLTALEEERKRIARELHDAVGSSLSAIKFGLETTLRQVEQGKAEPESLHILVSMTQLAIDESRRIMADLRPSTLDDLGIVITIGWFCREFQKIYPDTSIEKQICLREEEIPDSLKIVIFRVIQEAFHNIAKYSKANQVNLSLQRIDNMIELIIKDNGVGFDWKSDCFGNDDHKRGLGLTSMRERTELSGGSFSIASSSETGTEVRASWSWDKIVPND